MVYVSVIISTQWQGHLTRTWFNILTLRTYDTYILFMDMDFFHSFFENKIRNRKPALSFSLSIFPRNLEYTELIY